MALQTHNSFLASECQRLEAEKAIRTQTLARLREQVQRMRASYDDSTVGPAPAQQQLLQELDQVGVS